MCRMLSHARPIVVPIVVPYRVLPLQVLELMERRLPAGDRKQLHMCVPYCPQQAVARPGCPRRRQARAAAVRALQLTAPRLRCCRLLRMLTTRLGSLLVLGRSCLQCGIPVAFTSLPRERREAVLQQWAASPHATLRKVRSGKWMAVLRSAQCAACSGVSALGCVLYVAVAAGALHLALSARVGQLALIPCHAFAIAVRCPSTWSCVESAGLQGPQAADHAVCLHHPRARRPVAAARGHRLPRRRARAPATARAPGKPACGSAAHSCAALGRSARAPAC
jgi:hypothetical protein